MPTVLLRFYGRFAFAEGRNADNTPNGTIAALAPNYNTGGFEPHEVIMWIRRDAVVTKNNAGVPVTNLRPLHRLVSEGPIQQAECFVWDLRGRTVQVRDRQIAELPKDHGIADLADLENRKGRTAVFDKTFLNGSTNGPASAAIRLAGTGSTGVAFRGRCDFVSLPDAHANTPNPPTYGTTPTQFADFVEFEIGLTQMDPDQPPQSEPPQSSRRESDDNRDDRVLESVRDAANVPALRLRIRSVLRAPEESAERPAYSQRDSRRRRGWRLRSTRVHSAQIVPLMRSSGEFRSSCNVCYPPLPNGVRHR
jgi:hypothetical protein